MEHSCGPTPRPQRPKPRRCRALPIRSRRSQAERRESTIARLLDATIGSLAELGYARTTTAGVCERAQMSQGALFRHFPSRSKLIAGATAELCERHLQRMAVAFASFSQPSGGDPVEALVREIRSATRSQEHAAWHEVMVAARTDKALHKLVAPTLRAFEAELLKGLPSANLPTSSRMGTIMLSLMHLFDSESVTIAVYGNAELEGDRIEWLTGMLRRELALAE